MSVREWSIVAAKNDDINQGTEIIRFLDHSNNATANIAMPSAESDDAVLTSINNTAIISRRRKRRPNLVLEFERMRWQDALRLRQIESQDRAIYFCPNIDPSTVWMQPLLGNQTDFVRQDTVFADHSSDDFGWEWDQERQLFYRQTEWCQSANGATPFTLGGPYGIASRPGVHDFTNGATNPLPSNTGTGWSNVGGAGTVSYDNETRLPDAGDPDTSGSEGGITVLASDGATGSTGTEFQHSATGLGSGAQIVCSVLVRTHDAGWTARLKDDSGTVVSSKIINDSAGQWVLVRLQGEQDASGTTADVSLLHPDGHTVETTIEVGTVFISSMPITMQTGFTWPFPDFVETSQDQALTGDNLGAELAAGFTVSCIVQHEAKSYPVCYLGSATAYRLWIRRSEGNENLLVTLGSSDTSGNATLKTFSELGISTGDYFHLVVTVGTNGVSTYINGELVNTPSGDDYDVGIIDNWKYVGTLPASFLDDLGWKENGGMCMFRIDKSVWGASQVARHYATYFQPGGTAYVAPTLGWTFRIAELEWEPFNLDDGSLMVRGTIELKGLQADPKFRSLHPDLTSNTDG